MPVSVGWSAANQSVLHFTFEEPYNWSELERAMEVARQYHAEMNRMTVWMFDFSEVTGLPAGAIAVGRRIVRDTIPNRHPDMIILGANARVKSVWRVFEQLLGERYNVNLHFARTQDDIDYAVEHLHGVQAEHLS